MTSGLGTNSNHMHISVHCLLRNFFGGLETECKRGKMFWGCEREKNVVSWSRPHVSPLAQWKGLRICNRKV